MDYFSCVMIKLVTYKDSDWHVHLIYEISHLNTQKSMDNIIINVDIEDFNQTAKLQAGLCLFSLDMSRSPFSGMMAI